MDNPETQPCKEPRTLAPVTNRKQDGAACNETVTGWLD